jgi:hypothetical protein
MFRSRQLAQQLLLRASSRSNQLRTKAVWIAKSHHAPHEPDISAVTYPLVIMVGCGLAWAFEKMGFSHHDTITIPQSSSSSSSTASLPRRNTLLDGVRGTNWH